jgi:catechol 2,3-dioxygenase-like lactoylglutathione lyase family enzyme
MNADGDATRGIVLDHLIIPSRDRRKAAEMLATTLGVPWEDSSFGPFSAVYVSDSLTLDFDQAEADFPVLHYCFRIDDALFDAVVGRLRAQGIPYRSTPHGPADNRINTHHGGRIVYWSEPDGHAWEVLTVSYARQPAAAGSAQA